MVRSRLASMLLILSLPVSAQVKATRVRVGEQVMESLLVKRVAPAYPPIAREAQIQGPVIAQVIISKSGDVESVQILSGHPMLAPAAIEAIKQWKYRPYLVNGEPWAVETTVRVTFTLAVDPGGGVAGNRPGGIPAGEPGGILDAADAREPQARPPDRVRVAQRTEAALILKQVPPMYPADPRRDHIEGAVVLKVIVDKLGNVARIDLISGHPLLAPAAIDAVRQWKYRPYLLNQQPVEVETQVTVNFTLAP